MTPKQHQELIKSQILGSYNNAPELIKSEVVNSLDVEATKTEDTKEEDI